MTGVSSPSRRIERALLAARIAVWLVALRTLKFLVPLPRLVAFVAGPSRVGVRDPAWERDVVVWVDRLADAMRLDGRGNCLERSLVLYRLLGRAGAAPQLHVGVKRDTGRVTGHAWVQVDGRTVGGSGTDGHATVVSFAHDATRE